MPQVIEENKLTLLLQSTIESSYPTSGGIDILRATDFSIDKPLCGDRIVILQGETDGTALLSSLTPTDASGLSLVRVP